MYARCNPRGGQRSRQQIAVMYGQPDAVSVADIEIGMRGHKRLRFAGRRIGKTIDIMVAITLGMGDADQGAKHEVLLHAEPGLAGEVFTANKEYFAARAPLCS